jgi:hypothetical protein
VKIPAFVDSDFREEPAKCDGSSQISLILPAFFGANFPQTVVKQLIINSDGQAKLINRAIYRQKKR